METVSRIDLLYEEKSSHKYKYYYYFNLLFYFFFSIWIHSLILRSYFKISTESQLINALFVISLLWKNKFFVDDILR